MTERLLNICFYLDKAFDFNLKHLPPDVLKSEWTREVPVTADGQSSDTIGLARGRNMTELLEKQADTINYLQEHNIKLNQKLMTMYAQLKESHRI